MVFTQVTRKEFKFATKHELPFFFVSAADGTNIVKVRRHQFVLFQLDSHKNSGNFLSNCSLQIFETAIAEARKFKEGGGDALAEVLDLLADRKVSIDVFTSSS